MLVSIVKIMMPRLARALQKGRWPKWLWTESENSREHSTMCSSKENALVFRRQSTGQFLSAFLAKIQASDHELQRR